MNDFTEDSRFEHARELLDNEHDSAAEQAFTEIIERYPEWSGAYGNRGLARLHLGKDELALADFCRVAELDPEDAMACARQAEALRNMGRYREALESVVKALELDPQEPDAHYLRGWLFFYFGQYAGAIEDLETYIAQTQDFGEIEDMLEVCRTIEGVAEMGKAERERLLRENGFSLNTEYNKAFVEEGMFCPYAHCVRMFPARGGDAADACEITGFACPGGFEQAANCAFESLDDA